MRTRINNKIIIHWILVIIISVSLFLFIEINEQLLGILIGLSITTLIFNQTTHLYLKENQFRILKTNFLFFPSFRRSFDLATLREISIVDYNEDELIDFEGAIIPKILTGSFFYEPKYKLNIITNNKDVIELKVNIEKNDMLKMNRELKNIQ